MLLVRFTVIVCNVAGRSGCFRYFKKDEKNRGGELRMIMNVIDPQRAIIAAGIVILVGVVIFVVRNNKMIGNRLRSRYE